MSTVQGGDGMYGGMSSAMSGAMSNARAIGDAMLKLDRHQRCPLAA